MKDPDGIVHYEHRPWFLACESDQGDTSSPQFQQWTMTQEAATCFWCISHLRRNLAKRLY